MCIVRHNVSHCVDLQLTWRKCNHLGRPHSSRQHPNMVDHCYSMTCHLHTAHMASACMVVAAVVATAAAAADVQLGCCLVLQLVDQAC